MEEKINFLIENIISKMNFNDTEISELNLIFDNKNKKEIIIKLEWFLNKKKRGKSNKIFKIEKDMFNLKGKEEENLEKDNGSYIKHRNLMLAEFVKKKKKIIRIILARKKIRFLLIFIN